MGAALSGGLGNDGAAAPGGDVTLPKRRVWRSAGPAAAGPEDLDERPPGPRPCPPALRGCLGLLRGPVARTSRADAPFCGELREGERGAGPGMVASLSGVLDGTPFYSLLETGMLFPRVLLPSTPWAPAVYLRRAGHQVPLAGFPTCFHTVTSTSGPSCLPGGGNRG